MSSFFIIIFLQAAGLSVWYYGAALWLENKVGKKLCLIAPIGILAAASFMSFWIVFFFPSSGLIPAALFWSSAAAALFLSFSHGINKDALNSALLWFVSVCFLLVFAFWSSGPVDMIEQSRERWTHRLPIDNEIPLIFAQNLLSGNIAKPLIGDWLSSDRPPLQTGFFLLSRIPLIDVRVAYQLLGTSAQMLVIPSSYLLSRFLGSNRFSSAVVSVIVFFAPITLINGLYVWPKLLTAAFLLAASSIHLTPVFAQVSGRFGSGFLVGLLIAASALSHGAALFTVIGFIATSITLSRFGSKKYLAGLILSFSVMYAPWVIYQKCYDPPGDRLLKWHLAGVQDNKDMRPAFDVIVDKYSSSSADELASAFLEKIKGSFSGFSEALIIGTNPDNIRSSMFFRLIPSMGAVGPFSLFTVLIGLFVRGLLPLSFCILIGHLSWLILEFRPEDIIVHQSSYFNLLACIVVFGFLMSRSTFLLSLTILLQAFYAFYWF